MKKKVLSGLLAGFMAITICFTSFAEPDDTQAQEASTEDSSSPYLTGTQKKADENTENVDEDIQEEKEALIPEEYEEITISTADELIEFARNCTLDIWSVNKSVTLTADISLIGKQFQGIPTFGGIFNGNGHTISELSILEGVSSTGLFCHLQPTAIVKNLNVSGIVMPSGNQTFVGGIVGQNEGAVFNCSFKGVVNGNDYVGGIAGLNKLTGILSGCKTEGYVQGIHFTGGICGENMGNIVRGLNSAAINTENIDATITLESLNKFTSVLDAIKKGEQSEHEAENDSTTTDAGGICGLSIGVISRCINNGPVGYEHVGYNIGGIVGRQSGYVMGCINNGNILGRKDVGGIVGQAEPYITVDLSTDIAYQLSEAISDLHDIVTTTLSDAKSSSNTITSRLSVIQQFTAGAVDDLRYISAGTVDFANGVASATTEAFSRVDYVIDEASKKDGAIDQFTYAAKNTREAANDLDKTVQDLDIYKYMDDSEKARYDAAKEGIHTTSQEYSELYTNALEAYYNAEVENRKSRTTPNLKYKLDTPIEDGGRTIYYLPDGTRYDMDQPRLDLDKTPEEGSGTRRKGKWVHVDAQGNETLFPDPNNNDDATIDSDALNDASIKAKEYADEKYAANHGTTPTQDLATNTAIITDIVSAHMDEMSEQSRRDASSAMNNLEEASANLQRAGEETKRIASTVGGYDNIVYPQLSDEYRAHTTSLADNMQGMNDNFGILNNEVNSANNVLVDDLQAMADKFNDIMMLYTDAIDGVLDQDYTTAFEDVSLEEANICVDATIDSCTNYGTINGDIDVAGIAGTMAIEYDYDLESDVTGVKDSKLNTSYLTKCVLRQNKNYGKVDALKNYVGGVCGLQEMGTIISNCNFSNITTTSGEYAGGVTGSSYSYIVDSSSRGIITGSTYIGGIVGCGTHIRDCFSLVDIKEATNYYGAIAGFVSDSGIVRNNFFVSDTLAGIDRVSYSLKAEPTSYRDAMTTAPADFKNVMVTFLLTDTDDKETIISKVKKPYGDKLLAEDYPEIEPIEGYYISFDKNEDALYTDVVIRADYVRYKTTLADPERAYNNKQSEILVDGFFKEDDELTIERNKGVDLDDYKYSYRYAFKKIEDYETVRIIIPDDGQATHIIRFKVNTPFSIGGIKSDVYLITDKGKVKLEKVGTYGKYALYEITGNDITLSVDVKGINSFVSYILIAVLILLFAIMITTIVLIVFVHKNGRKVPKIFRRVVKKVSNKIENKEQIFYNEDEERDDEEIEKEKKYKNTEKKDEIQNK